MISYPKLDPVLIGLGPIQIRWYGLAYILGVVSGVWFLRDEFRKRLQFAGDDFATFMSYLMAGILLGGRLGYVLFYDFSYYAANPLRIAALWQGGMSFHGGAIGAVAALLLFAKWHDKNVWDLLDLLGIGATPGLGFGRLANFVNGELYGRVSDVPWAMVFPRGGDLARHPSQLYEAFFEGFLLFFLLYFLMKKAKLARGQLFAAFLIFYGAFRFAIEFFREPDVQLGFVGFGWMTMGQVLCVVMMVLGALIFTFSPRLTRD